MDDGEVLRSSTPARASPASGSRCAVLADQRAPTALPFTVGARATRCVVASGHWFPHREAIVCAA